MNVEVQVAMVRKNDVVIRRSISGFLGFPGAPGERVNNISLFPKLPLTFFLFSHRAHQVQVDYQVEEKKQINFHVQLF